MVCDIQIVKTNALNCVGQPPVVCKSRASEQIVLFLMLINPGSWSK